MNAEFADRVVVVTGASRGIGLACAGRFATGGARCVLISRDAASLDEAIRSIGPCVSPPKAIAVDLSDMHRAQAAMDEAQAAVGPIDILVNCAGEARQTAPDEIDAASWHVAMEAKYFTYMHAISAVLPRMAARERGAIVNVIGMGGKVANPAHLPGGAANAALMLVTTGLAAAYGRKGLRINAVSPGGTLTARVQQSLDVEHRMTGRDVADILARREASIPLRRLGTPEEVASVVAFLASDAASYVTGAIVPMDGGRAAVI